MIALATCAELPAGHEEDELAALLQATWTIWDDPSIDWAAFELVVLRSPWDYTERPEAFLRWVRSLGSVANPYEVVAWNTDKRYLQDIAQAGLPCVPTTFVGPGEPFVAPMASQYVVKPSVSAGAQNTGRFRPGTADDEAALELVEAIHASGRVAMVQPYLRSVDLRGETALLYADGMFSHAISKAQILQPGEIAVMGTADDPPLSAREPTDTERALADRAMAWLGEHFGTDALAYARVDLVDDEDGLPVVLELELVEPALYLTHAPGSAERFAAAFRRRA